MLGWSGALLMVLVGVTLLLLIVREAFPASRQGDSDPGHELLKRRCATPRLTAKQCTRWL